MTDLKTPGDKPLSMPTAKLSIKRSSEQGTVRQSFSHGRSKTVVVEKVKRRTGPAEPQAPVQTAAKRVAPGPAVARPAAGAPTARGAAPAAPQPAARPAPAAPSAGQKASLVLHTLTDEERDARSTALVEARRREDEERQHAEEEARHRAQRDEVERKEREAAEERKREEEERRRGEEQARRKAEEEARRRFGDVPAPSRPPGSPIPRLDPRPAGAAAATSGAPASNASPGAVATTPAATRPALTPFGREPTPIETRGRVPSAQPGSPPRRHGREAGPSPAGAEGRRP